MFVIDVGRRVPMVQVTVFPSSRKSGGKLGSRKYDRDGLGGKSKKKLVHKFNLIGCRELSGPGCLRTRRPAGPAPIIQAVLLCLGKKFSIVSLFEDPASQPGPRQ